jgi:antitoxin ParD1/3/4
MTVTLPPQLEAMIEEKATSGRYADASEVMEEALRLLDERDRLQHLRAALAIGLEQIERGEDVEYTPELLDEMDQAALTKFREGRQPKSDVVP